MKKIALLIIVLMAMIGTYKMNENHKKEEINFYFIHLPFSSDPIDYDHMIHHYAFSSVFRSLISLGGMGQVKPELAASWSNEDNFKSWTFNLKTNLLYSNGEAITPEDILKNFKRIIYFKKIRNSQSGLFEHLKGFESINEIDFEIEGMALSGNILKFVFDKPLPDLLQKISFGFYSLAHPSLYDSETGQWKKDVELISSNDYIVSDWSNEKFQLSLRADYDFKDNKKPINKVNFKISSTVKKTSELINVDIMVTDKMSLVINDDFIFNGSSTGLNIGYVACQHWNELGHPMNNIKIRKELRRRFLAGLKGTGFLTTNSFFPPSLSGITEIVEEDGGIVSNFESAEILVTATVVGSKIEENQHKMSLGEYIQAGIDNIKADKRFIIKSQKYNIETYKDLDMLFSATGIESDNYWDTIRFMFLSKDGIRLPDATGLIKEELNKENPDINFINQELYNQAIIWPIRHYSRGFWFNKNSNIDYSEINFDLPSIDFKFLKWK